MSSRTIIIGDVHGCDKELARLLKKLEVRKQDRLIFVGDILNKGPNSSKVWDMYLDLKAEAVLGNHEWYLIEQADRKKPKWNSYFRLQREFGKKKFNRLIDQLHKWPLYIKEEEFNVVHAGRVPGKRLRESTARELTTIRTWDGKGTNLQSPKNPPWFDFYTRNKLIVYGHWAAKGLVQRDNVIGLDSGCLYGGRLSALVLPERRIISVKAKRSYCPIG